MSGKRLHIFYSGNVQGVGFRWTARNIAVRLDLTGWARNLRDGRVECVCEGGEKSLKAFLDSMRDEFLENYIRDIDFAWEKPTEEFSQFEIKF